MKRTSYHRLLLLLLLILLSPVACRKSNTQVTIGFIRSSVNHIPLSYVLQQNPGEQRHYKMVSFASGWEVQEALAAGKLDMAVLPFTYAWTLRSKGYKIKTMACLERETDAIVTTANITLPADLNHRKVGLLRASSLEALMDDFAARHSIGYTPVYFRSPAEMTAALSGGQVDAIVSYVPLIQKMPDSIHVLHWFSEDYPQHPCCDLVVTEKALEEKGKAIRKLSDVLQPGIDSFNTKSRPAVDFLQTYFSLTRPQTSNALAHVRYQSYVSEEDAVFERRMMQVFIRKGYLTRLPTDNEMYYIPVE